MNSWRRVQFIAPGVGLAVALATYRSRSNAGLCNASPVVYDAAVVGGGVVGLAVLRELAVHGYRVALLEKESHLVAGAASSGNSGTIILFVLRAGESHCRVLTTTGSLVCEQTGIGCTGYDAPSGTLERALLRRSIQRHPELMRTLGLSYRHVRAPLLVEFVLADKTI